MQHLEVSCAIRPIVAVRRQMVKYIHIHAWIRPEGSRRLRLPDFKTISTWRW